MPESSSFEITAEVHTLLGTRPETVTVNVLNDGSLQVSQSGVRVTIPPNQVAVVKKALG